MNTIKPLLVIVLFLLCNLKLLQGQQFTQYGKSDTLSIQSQIFNSDRKVILTKSLMGKSDTVARKTIIYFDADDNHINGTVLQSADNLTATGEMPKSNLVGIMQVDRNTEFLEKEKLAAFLVKELIPYLKANQYDTQKITLIGHSFGGYFATYLYLTNNGLFNSCIAVSPAYWPNKKDLFNDLNSLGNNSISGNFYMAIGNKRWDDISITKYIDEMDRLLTKHQRQIRYRLNRLEGFSHNATPTVGIGLGLSYVFDLWEWQNILKEQERRLKSSPDFWGHLEIKADALYHLKRYSEAKEGYLKSRHFLINDKEEQKEIIRTASKRLKEKIKKCK